MHELGGDAAEIVPHAGEDFLDLGVGFFRERGAQLLAAEAVLLEQRSELAHAARRRNSPRAAIRAFDRAQQPDRDRADRRVEQLF